MRKICIITGTRAEYGLLKGLMEKIQGSKSLELQTVVTGMHLSPEFGLTYKEIEYDGFVITKKLEMLLSADTPSSITKSTGLGMVGFGDIFQELQPDIIVILGDRFEMLAAAFAGLIAGVPIAHIHGGEVTTGAFDEALRHSISKMAWWHFTATADYRQRVIQLGERPERVFLCGGLGVDGIKKNTLLPKKDLEKRIGFSFGKKNLLITYHPATAEYGDTSLQINELLSALKKHEDTKFIFTFPNADSDSRVIKDMVRKFVNDHKDRSVLFSSMGVVNYWSAMQYVDAVVGNSSSGLLEAPSFKIGTINIGDRQKGRVKADSVIDCMPDASSITKALNKIYSAEFKKKLADVKNPYEGENTIEQIVKILEEADIPTDLKKVFYDL